MPGPLYVPLPRTLLVTYLVLSRATVADPDLVVSSTARELPPSVLEALAAHIGDLRILPLDDLATAPIPPQELLAASGTSRATRDLVAAAEWGCALLLRVPPAAAVTGDVAVRAAARLVARKAGGVVVDTALPRAYAPSEDPAEPTRTSDLVTFDHEPEATGWRVTTRGLARFGLPELSATGVPDELAPACDALLMGVAHRAIEAFRDVGNDEPAQLPLPGTVNLADVAAAYGQDVSDDPAAERAVTVTLGSPDSPGAPTVLRAAPETTRELFAEALPQ